jgi:hypothetical protein
MFKRYLYSHVYCITINSSQNMKLPKYPPTDEQIKYKCSICILYIYMQWKGISAIKKNEIL